MTKVFVAQHPTEAHLLKSVLESIGIPSEIRGGHLFGTRGGTPFSEGLPEIWVLNDDQASEAREVLGSPRTEAGPGEGQSWKCVKCGETVEAHFTACWQCKTPASVTAGSRERQMPVSDADEARVADLLLRDVAATLGARSEELIRSAASHHREFEDDYDRYVERVVEDVQQHFHDLHVDTTWPTCPHHPNHPMWFSAGWWQADGKRIARLGELAHRTQN